MNNQNWCQLLQETRRARGYTQSELGRRASISHTTLCKVERGNLRLGARAIVRLATALRTDSRRERRER